MVWATFKPLMLLFILLTVGLYIANLFYYKHKWWTCRQPSHKIDYRMAEECKIVEEGQQLLPPLFRKRTIYPLIHHVVIIGTFSTTGILGNFMNEFHLSHYSAYSLAIIWVYDHYSNYRLILNWASVLYNLAHTTHFFAFATTFVFSATIIANLHRRAEYPKLDIIDQINTTHENNG